MKHFSIIVRAEYDDEAGVWVATSKDIDGLAIEAATIEELQQKLPGVLSDLLEVNGFDAPEGISEIPYHLMAEQLGRIPLA